MKETKNLLSQILYEAKSYNSFSDIEKLVEVGTDLSMIPIQPLYVSLVSSSSDQVAQIIPKLSKDQKQAMIDLDLWQKDQVDVNAFEFWIEVYSKVSDLDITKEFVSSDDFLMYLKSRINIWTFDTEDPLYPDHDYYFLTDDMLLLVEYSEEYRYPNELKYLIRNMYDKFGVENAYSILFKLINDSFAVIEEEGYQAKKERLRVYGFVDHYEALEQLNSFITYKQVDNFISNKKNVTANVDLTGQNQSLHSSALVSFDSEMENIFAELRKVKDERRAHYLHFIFIRLINSTITLNDAVKGGRVELTRIGKVTKNNLELGLQKIKSISNIPESESIFETYDFFDLYRIGNSLLQIERNRIKKALKNSPFNLDEHESFLGAWWCSFLENSDSEIPKNKGFGAALHTKNVDDLATYEFWKSDVSLFKAAVPFIASFFEGYQGLKSEGKLNDDFYLNYEVENIDFEAIIISSFMNYSLGNFSGNDVNRMGITISELQQFLSDFFLKNGNEYILLPLVDPKVTKMLNEFIKMFGFEEIKNFDKYLYGVLAEHLSGYEFDTLEDEDFKHIGGPILLNSLLTN
jgi:hypothetical protein